MNAIWLYPLYLVGLVGGIAVLVVLGRKGVSWPARLWVGVTMSVGMGLIMFRISEPPDLFSDLYKAYYPAAKAILAENGASRLAETMRQGAGGFVNLPILAWLFAPFGLLPPTVAGYVFLALGVAATIGAWYSLARLANLDRNQSLLLLFLFAANGPFHNSLREGNTTHFILLLLVLGMWMTRRKRDFLAGLIFGFAALIKLPLLLLGVFFAVRGRWRVALGGASVCGVAALGSLLLFGWDLHVFWYEHSIRPFAETPLAAFNVQSVQGFFARLQHGDRYLVDWTPHALHPAVRMAGKLAALALLGIAALVIAGPGLFRRGRLLQPESDAVIELETCSVVVLATMISTVSWSHYYLWMLLPAAYLIGGRPQVLADRRIRWAGWVAVIAAMPPVVIVQAANPLLRKAHGYLAVSHYVIAAGLLLGVLLVATWRTKSTMLDAAAKPEPLPDAGVDCTEDAVRGEI